MIEKKKKYGKNPDSTFPMMPPISIVINAGSNPSVERLPDNAQPMPAGGSYTNYGALADAALADVQSRGSTEGGDSDNLDESGSDISTLIDTVYKAAQPFTNEVLNTPMTKIENDEEVGLFDANANQPFDPSITSDDGLSVWNQVDETDLDSPDEVNISQDSLSGEIRLTPQSLQQQTNALMEEIERRDIHAAGEGVLMEDGEQVTGNPAFRMEFDPSSGQSPQGQGSYPSASSTQMAQDPSLVDYMTQDPTDVMAQSIEGVPANQFTSVDPTAQDERGGWCESHRRMESGAQRKEEEGDMSTAMGRDGSLNPMYGANASQGYNSGLNPQPVDNRDNNAPLQPAQRAAQVSEEFRRWRTTGQARRDEEAAQLGQQLEAQNQVDLESNSDGFTPAMLYPQRARKASIDHRNIDPNLLMKDAQAAKLGKAHKAMLEKGWKSVRT